MKTVVTKKGTTLPLTNLKGKDYLMVAYRILWFTEEVPNFHISTQFLVLDDVQTVAQVTVVVLNEAGQALRKAVGTKRETKADFSDHLEKSETGALGRALIQLGYGTQYALADLDEGDRLADAPLVDTRPTKTPLEVFAPAAKKTDALAQKAAEVASLSVPLKTETNSTEKPKVSSFRKQPTRTKVETDAVAAEPVKSNGAISKNTLVQGTPDTNDETDPDWL